MTAYQAPEAIMVLILVLAIITHTLTLSAIRLTDWVFYHGETRQLRFNLRRLLRSAGEEGSIEANLGLALETLCNSLDATYGLIGIIDQGSLHWAAKCHWGIHNHSRSVVLLAGMALLVNAVAQLGSSFYRFTTLGSHWVDRSAVARGWPSRPVSPRSAHLCPQEIYSGLEKLAAITGYRCTNMPGYGWLCYLYPGIEIMDPETRWSGNLAHFRLKQTLFPGCISHGRVDQPL